MEGLCTSILGSFAVKTPVVATRAGGIPEIVKDLQNKNEYTQKYAIFLLGELGKKGNFAISSLEKIVKERG